MALSGQVERELSRCVRCGTCMAVCPVYEVMRQEGGVARGKVALVSAMKEGRIQDDRRYRHFLTACLLCGRCKTSCPNEVDTVLIVQAARAELARKNKIGWFKRFVLRRILPSRRVLPGLFKGARISRVLWAARVAADSGLHIRFLHGPKGQKRWIPPLAKPFFLDRPRRVEPRPAGRRVAFFVGCINNHLRPEAAEAGVRVLERLGGVQVDVPPGQGCCGLPAYGSGELDGARKLLRRNLEALWPRGTEPPDAVTSVCASCAYMLHRYLPELLSDDAELAERARVLAQRVVPFSVLWARWGEVTREGPGRSPDRPGPWVTFHDPCHLSRGFGEKDSPRLLLTSLNHVRLVEMCHPCRCCGHGGSFNLTHHDLSSAMGQDKVQRVLATGAQMVVTECSGCVLQLMEMLHRCGSRVEVLTTAEAADKMGFLGAAELRTGVDIGRQTAYSAETGENSNFLEGCDGHKEKDDQGGGRSNLDQAQDNKNR